MQALVDPSADGIWEAVSTTVTAAGVEEKQPRTNEEWHEVRLKAIRLVEGANLLQVQGRQVVREGVELEDKHVEGNAKAHEIAAAIAKDPAKFSAAAQDLKSTGLEVLAAIDARDVGRFVKAGAALDAACEHCHSTYWYPNQVIPAWPAKLSEKKP